MNRRRVLQAGCLTAGHLLSGCASGFARSPSDCSIPSASTPSANWPMPGKDAANTGFADVSTNSIADDPVRVTRSNDRPLAQPALVDGVLYSSFGRTDDRSHTLRAIDLDAGTELWRVERGNSISQPACADDRVVFVSSSTADDVATVSAVDREFGREQWQFDLGGPSGTPPTIADGTVFVSRYGRDDDGRLFALDVETGDPRWEYQGGHLGATPAVAGGTVFLPESDGNFVALDAETGDRVWSLADTGGDGLFGDEVASTVNCSPAVIDGTVVLGEDTGIRAVDACSGQTQWQTDITDADGRSYSVLASPVVVDGTAYALASFTGHDVAGLALAFDVETGEQRWKTSVDYFTKYPEPVGTRDAIVVSTWDDGPDTTYVIDRGDGSIRRELAYGGAAVVVDSHLFVSHSSGIYDFAVAADG